MRCIARSTVDGEAECPSAATIAWIRRWPYCGYLRTYLSSTSSIASTAGVGHGPFAGAAPALFLDCMRQ